jgi:tRNA A-37 threonylcarbamoyl transferase component Bud32
LLCMLTDLTALDPLGWEALKGALNQRVIIDRVRFVPSRKNRVWIIETNVRPVVVKRFLAGRCGNEFELLLRARNAGLDAPLPLAKSGDYLVTEFVPGETCEVLINQMFSSVASDGVGRWLALFHERLSDLGRNWIMSDAVPSNFILAGESIYGLDLEDAVIGDPLEDVGRMAASMLDTDPLFTPLKFDLCHRMIRSYERQSHTDIIEDVRPFISKHLRLDSKNRPLFRRTLIGAAKSIEKSWPALA